MLATIALFSLMAVGNIEGRREQTRGGDESGTLTGRAFRSDTNESISNCYILLMQEKDSRERAEHFYLRTDEKGNYIFNDIPAGRYTVSLHAWFPKSTDVPCQNSPEAKTADDGSVTVEWQRKSEAFMEVVTIKGFSVTADQDLVRHKTVKDFDLLCK